jgi:hypothetical protein
MQLLVDTSLHFDKNLKAPKQAHKRETHSHKHMLLCL